MVDIALDDVDEEHVGPLTASTLPMTNWPHVLGGGPSL
jgi:hypothetical protein